LRGSFDMGDASGSHGIDGSGAGDELRAPSKLSKAEFRIVHERMTGRPISEEEVEILFDLLDADADGKLRLEEVEAVAGGGTGAGAGPGSNGSTKL
jgi:hypothetical protein